MLADSFSIPLVELLSQEGFRGLVDTDVKWLQSVSAVSRNHDYMDVIVFKDLQKTLCPLTSELVEDRKCWVVRMELQVSSFSTDVGKEYLFNVCFHCALIRPVVVAVCYVPIGWEVDSWKAPFGSALVDELGWKEISCE